MRFKAIIVEDELPSRDRLNSLLAGHDDIEVIAVATDGPEGVRIIDQLKPDLAFLDIQLPVYTGFEVLKKIRHKPHIIFITAYDQYAISAFEANALDYLLKPTSPDRLNQALDKFRDRQIRMDDNIISIIQKAMNRKEYLTRLTVKTGDEILFIPVEEVYWFQARDKYVFLNTFDKYFIVDLTLKELEQSLNPDLFIRIHKNAIVAQSKISKVKRTISGHYIIRMVDARKTTLDIGRTYLSEVRNKPDF